MPESNQKNNNQESVDDAEVVVPITRAERRDQQRDRKHRASRQNSRAHRRLTIRAEQRANPDTRKIARAIIAMTTAAAERDAQAATVQEASDPEQADE